MPLEVITDARVSWRARVVYSFLAGCAFDGPRVKVGQRYVGEALGTSRMSINRSIRELVKTGHLKAITGPSGERYAYELKSPVFSYTRARRYAAGKLTLTQQMAHNWALARDEKPN